MPMRLLEKSALSLCMILTGMVFSEPVNAWWDLGHTNVCEVAYSLITPSAQREVDRLLSLESEVHKLQQERFGPSCTWADRIKKDDPRTRTWHYLNSQPGDSLVAHIDRPEGGDIITALESQLAVLSQPTSDNVLRAIALRWIGHLVGDLHQPMHLGYKADWGGNKYRLSIPPPLKAVLQKDRRDTTNMHAVWDGYLLLYAAGRDHRRLSDIIAQPIASGSVHPEVWANDALALLKSPKLRYATTERLTELSEAYLADNADTALSQLTLAAHRLALLLDAALSTPSPQVD